MGKKKKEKQTRYTAFDYMSGGRIRKLGDRVGVDASDYNVNYGRDTGNGGKAYKGDRDDYNKAVMNAARNDYDLRRTVEAAAMSGKKKAIKLQKKGFKDIGDVKNWENFSKKAAKRHGQGGDFSSNSDYMGLTKSMVQRDRRKQTEAYDKQYASQEMLNSKIDELKQKFKTEQEPEDAPEIQESEELAAAKERLAGGTYNTTDSIYKVNTPRKEPTTAFRKQNEQAPAGDDVETKAVGSYLEQYKKDVLAGGRIREATTNNLNNAYNTVIRSDI